MKNIATVKMIKNLIDGNTPLKSKALSAAYPIGRVYISADDVSPAALFGGTWEKIEGKFLLGAGGGYSLNSIGGSADAVVVRHNHSKLIYTPTGIELKWGGGMMVGNAGCIGAEESGHSVSVEAAGESGAGKNMPPYVAVNIWKRVA